MSINYKKADPNAIGHRVMKDRAIDLEGKAYAMETEVECLTRMFEVDPDNENIPKLLEEANQGVVRFRRAAMRASGAAPLTPEEIHSCHENFLEGWLGQVEQVHAERSALINEANRQMGLSGEDSLNPEEMMELQVGLDELLKEVSNLEIRHKFCCELISQLNNEPIEEVDDVEEPLHVVEKEDVEV